MLALAVFPLAQILVIFSVEQDAALVLGKKLKMIALYFYALQDLSTIVMVKVIPPFNKKE